MAKTKFPHENVYTRLKSSLNGVGVFAIRDIPIGTRLFVGDIGETVQILVSDVEKVQDTELRRMYYDFCPVIKSHFIAPADFNQMTMGWYINHSHDPNVKVDEFLQFATSRPVGLGEELTADYLTYSEHASAFVRGWSR
jgi:uncharacterized protein